MPTNPIARMSASRCSTRRQVLIGRRFRGRRTGDHPARARMADAAGRRRRRRGPARGGAARALGGDRRQATPPISARPTGSLTIFRPMTGRPHRLAKFRGQRQKWFALRFTGSDDEIDPPTPRNGQPAEFDAWRWERLDRVADLVVPFRREVYREVAQQFREVRGGEAKLQFGPTVNGPIAMTWQLLSRLAQSASASLIASCSLAAFSAEARAARRADGDRVPSGRCVGELARDVVARIGRDGRNCWRRWKKPIAFIMRRHRDHEDVVDGHDHAGRRRRSHRRIPAFARGHPRRSRRPT